MSRRISVALLFGQFSLPGLTDVFGDELRMYCVCRCLACMACVTGVSFGVPCAPGVSCVPGAYRAWRVGRCA